jgi:hypothetical protein
MALSSYGTEFYAAGVLIGEVTSISVGGSSLTEIDITSLTSTDKEYIMGALESGNITVDFFAPADFASIQSVIQPISGDTVASVFNSYFAGAQLTATANGICTNLSISAEQDGAVQASSTIKLTTAITWS